MPKSLRPNDPCHCGSGKKYKKCHRALEMLVVPPLPNITTANVPIGNLALVRSQSADLPPSRKLEKSDLIDALAGDELWATAESKIFGEFEGLLSELRHGEAASSRTAMTDLAYLHTARQLIELRLTEAAQQFSPSDWLERLRTAPAGIWSGSLQSAAVYDSMLAETISARSKSTKKPSPSQYLLIDISETRKVAEFCVGVRYLSQIHTNIRWAEKGAPIDFGLDRCGKAHPTPELEQAVGLYDSRGATDQSFLVTCTGLGDVAIATDDSKLQILAVSRTVPSRPNAEMPQTNFGMQLVSLDDLAKFNACAHSKGASWWSAIPALLAALLGAAMLSVKGNVEQITRIGCLVITIEQAKATGRQYIDYGKKLAETVFPGQVVPDTFLGLLEAAAKIEGMIWPLQSGHVVRFEGNRIFLDLYCATTSLQQRLSLKPTGGALGNLKGKEFESSVQGAIDLSAWAPGNELRDQLVGTVINRADGSDLTDFDAVGIRNNMLLLVSCKGLAYSDNYDMGEIAVITSVERKVMEAISKWKEVVSYVTLHPNCLHGFDFSRYTIISTVCYPFVPYLTIGPATEEIDPGLRRVCSFSELLAWLSAP